MSVTIKTPSKDYLAFDVYRNDYGVMIYSLDSDDGYIGYAILVSEDGEKTLVHCTFSNGTGVYQTVEFAPTGDPNISDMRVHYDIGQDIYDLLVREGLADEEVIDRMLVCPECEGIPAIRSGCGKCGSFRIKPDILVHHYACGNVNYLNQFVIDQVNGSLTCSKCHKAGLIVNCDYDVTHGMQRCVDCGWIGNAARLIGSCHLCDTSFLVSEAKEKTIKSYTMRGCCRAG